MRHTVEPTMLPAPAKQIYDETPSVEMSAELRSGQLRSVFASIRIDVAINVRFPSALDIRVRRLHRGKPVVAVHKDHLILRDPWTLDAYLTCGHASASSRRAAVSYVDHIVQETGRQRCISMHCRNQWTGCRLAAASDLIFTVPERFVKSSNAPVGSVIMPFPLPNLYLYLHWHTRTEADPATRWLRDKIVVLLRKKPRRREIRIRQAQGRWPLRHGHPHSCAVLASMRPPA